MNPAEQSPDGSFRVQQIDVRSAGPVASTARGVLANGYVAAVLFGGEDGMPVDGLFPVPLRIRRLVERMQGTNTRPRCRDIARRFPGLLSTCNAIRVCECPLKSLCGANRVDTIRVECRGQTLGDLMMFAETEGPLALADAMTVQRAVGELAEAVWNARPAEDCP